MANSLKLFFLLFFFSLGLRGYSQLIFNETFGEGEDAITGSDDLGGIAWSTACPTCLDAGDYFKIQGGK